MKNSNLSLKGQNTGRIPFTNDFPTHQAVAAGIDNSLRWIRFFTYAFVAALTVSAFFILNAGI